MAKTTKRPRAFAVGKVTVSVVRGPRSDARDCWYWRARLYQDGRYHAVWTGWGTRAAVEVEVARIVAGGQPVGSERDDHEPIETMRDLLEVWLGMTEDRRDLSENSRRNYRKSAKLLARHLGSVRLDRIDVGVLEGFRNRALAEGYATQVVFDGVKVMRRVYKWGQQLGLVEDPRPLGTVRIRVSPKREKVTPTVEEFWHVVDALPQPWQRTLAIVMEGTGCRMGEAAALTWDQVDLHNRIIRFPRSKAKTAGECVIPDELAEHLVGLRPDRAHGRVLPVTHGTAVSNFGDALRDLPWDEMGIRRFTSHGIRRMTVDRMYSGGADVGAVAAQLRQSPQVALKYYRQASRQDRERAVALAGLGKRPAVEKKVLSFRRRVGTSDEEGDSSG